jgi:hypothetical protein
VTQENRSWQHITSGLSGAIWPGFSATTLDCEAASAQTGGFLRGSRSDTGNAQSKGVDMEQNRATEYMASSYV